MQLQKLKVLAEADAVREVEARYQAEPAGWALRITYATRGSERVETRLGKLTRTRSVKWHQAGISFSKTCS